MTEPVVTTSTDPVTTTTTTVTTTEPAHAPEPEAPAAEPTPEAPSAPAEPTADPQPPYDGVPLPRRFRDMPFDQLPPGLQARVRMFSR